MMRPGFSRLDRRARDPLREHHRRGQVHRERMVPILAFEILRASGRRDAGVVHQDIDNAAEFVIRLHKRTIQIGVERDVGTNSGGFDMMSPRNLRGKFPDAIGAPRDQGDIGARDRKRNRTFDPKSRRRASDQRPTPPQREQRFQ